MKLNPPQTVAQVAKLINAKFSGDENHIVSGINEIHRVQPGDLTFVDVAKYYKKALNSAATTILINKQVEVPAGKAIIISDDPFRDYNKLTEHYQPRSPLDVAEQPKLDASIKVGRNVSLGKNVSIGKNCEIGHNVVIGSNVSIGEGTLIYPNVVIYDYSVIGKNCCVQSGSIIGGEAFYFKKRSYGRDKMLSKGRTVLEDNVEIGACTTIDRGVSADTIVGEHTKIDNLVQVGHDTTIGKRCVIAAQVGIAGVCRIEDDVILWGKVGIPSGVTIGAGAILHAMTGVFSDLPGNKIYSGIPAQEQMKTLRQYATMEKISRMFHKLERLL